ncbi:MAG: hypothetical protein H0X30_01395 [Anaerolineae bacterium]|nr:hypothetical protein [Anaerolineae bacterium]
MSAELLELVWQGLKSQLNDLNQQVEDTKRVERALIADSTPAFTVANLPTAANGGLGNGSSYATILWASNGRKSGEGAGTGTGVLVVWQASLGQWLRTSDYTQVLA